MLCLYFSLETDYEPLNVWNELKITGVYLVEKAVKSLRDVRARVLCNTYPNHVQVIHVPI